MLLRLDPHPYLAALRLALAALLLPCLAARSVAAQQSDAPPSGGLTPQIFDAVMRLHAEVPASARTAPYLGTEREGSAILIGEDGLVLTIGYLVTEASAIELTLANGRAVPATLVGLDNESGLALLRSLLPIAARPLPLGHAATLTEAAPVLIVAGGGPAAAQPARVVSRRAFAGYWEYLLDAAIFTAPPHPAWSGAALIGEDGGLLGVGSLVVNDAVPGKLSPGNMFVPIDLLQPSMAALLAQGRPAAPPHPWLGVNLDDRAGRLTVLRVSKDGPADRAGLVHGDVVTAIAGREVDTLADFYHVLWGLGTAGIEVSLTVRHEGDEREIRIRSIDRYSFLKAGQTY